MPSQLRSRKRDAIKDQESERNAHSVAGQSVGEGRERSSKSASTGVSDEDENEDEEDDDEEEESDDNEDEDEEDVGEAEEDEDDSPFKILERLDPKLLGPGFDPAWLTRKPHPTASLHPVSAEPPSGDKDDRGSAATTDDAEFYGAMIQMLTHVLGSSDSVAWPNHPTPGSQLAPSPFGHAYSSPAQTPHQAAASLSASRRSAADNRKSELSTLQPLIQALISRLGKDQQLPRHPVGEQDLTALLQTLMEQQQRQQDQQTSSGHSASSYSFPQQSLPAQMASSSNSHRASQQFHGGVQNQKAAPSSYQALNFADLDFEDEDEDDPDFNPDLNPDLPLPSAWSMAVRDVVASEESRAAAAAVAASHSGTPSGVQTPANAIRIDNLRAGNLHSSAGSPPRTSSRSNELRRTSLVEHAAQSYRRSSDDMQHHAHTEGDRSFSRDDSTSDIEAMTAPAPPSQQQQADAEANAPRKRGRKPVLEPGEAKRRRAQRNVEYQRMRRQVKKAEESEQSETVLELRAEVKMLRAEMERLRDENAMLRAQRELDRLQRNSS